jgi:predicted TIM-barrel fold metal-dependent hydrolase
MQIYQICVERDIPVMTHCSPGGIWQYGLSEKDRRAYSSPESYMPVFKEYPTLRLCMAHFGGAEEWARHLNREVQKDKHDEKPWVRTIYEMIACGDYPNLYTDISYTAFTPRLRGLYIDLIDYLKVLLSHPRVRTRVLFGSDYYLVARENMSEKEASILLRSRLGEDLYKQIAYTNPRAFLGEPPEAKAIKKKTARK